MTVVTPIGELTREEARELTDEVKADAHALWTKLLGLYEGKAHKALGYKTWGQYYEAEFGGSVSQANRLLAAGRVLESLEPAGFRGEEASGSPLLNEATARELQPLLRSGAAAVREAYEEAAGIANGHPTATQMRDVVRRRSNMTVVPSPPEPRAPKPEWVVPDWVSRLDALASELMWLCSSGTTGPGDNSRSAQRALGMLADVTADLRSIAAG